MLPRTYGKCKKIDLKRTGISKKWTFVSSGQTHKHWQTFRILLVRHACAFGYHDKHCLTSRFGLPISKPCFARHTAKSACQAHVFVVTKLTNIVIQKQNFKCSRKYACSFDRGFKNVLPPLLILRDLLPALLCIHGNDIF